MAIGVGTPQSWTDYGATVTRSFECTGSERCLVVAINVRYSGQVTGITFNGVALTKAADADDGGNRCAAEVWYLVNPAATTANIVATCSSARRVQWTAYCLTGVAQGTPVGTGATATGNSTGPSVAVSSASGELVIDAVAALADTDTLAGLTLTVGASQTQTGNALASSGAQAVRGGSSREAGASTVTMSWTLSTGTYWAVAAVPFKASSGVTDTTAPAAAVLTATPDAAGEAIDLSAVMPADVDVAAYEIRALTSGYPATDRSNGSVIDSGSTTPGATETYSHGSLTNGARWYYAVFVQDSTGNWNTGEGTAQATAVAATAPTLSQRYKQDGSTTIADGTTAAGQNPVIQWQLASTCWETGKVTGHLVYRSGSSTGTPPSGSATDLDSRSAAAGTFQVEHPAASGTFITWPQAGLAIATYGGRKVRVLTPEAGATRYCALKVASTE